jgi:outer membrane protein
MKRFLIATALTAGSLTASLLGADAPHKIGVVNFATCVTDSKYGQQEQNAFEAMKKQMSSLMEDTEKQLREITEKLQDKDYLDGLSPEAEQELKNKYNTLSDEMQRYQQQFYQVLQQTNYKLVQNIGTQIGTASEKVAAAKGINAVINKEACFYYLPSLDITSDVIKEMDKVFEADAKKQPATPPANMDTNAGKK